MGGIVAAAYLIWPDGERKLRLSDGKTWSIGRGEGCGVLLHGRAVSRLHALIQRRDDGHYYLVDLGSRNGSFVNGRRVSVPLQLNDNDRLLFAEQELTFRNPEGAFHETVPQQPETRDLPTSAMLLQSLTTIVVVDIRDFTRLARTLPEGLLSQTIGTWFFRVGKIAEEWGSWGQQYMGDAVMAVWVHDDPAQVPENLTRALRAVCDIDRVTSEISRTLPLPNPLRIGAGVDTGPSVLGGSYYTALGDTVNIAIRLEAASKTLGFSVVLGEKTYRALSAFPTRPFQPVEVKIKGHEGPLQAWGTSFEELDTFLGSDSQHRGKTVPASH